MSTLFTSRDDPDAGAIDVGDNVELKTVDRLAPVWDRLADLESRITDRPVAIFLDYDGTLTPIVENYEKATLSKSMRSALERLVRCCRVAIISGRDLMDVRDRVGIQNLFFAGSHGFDIAGPAGFRERVEKAEQYLPALDAAEEELRDALESIEGAAVERKTFSIAVHYRQVARLDVESVEQTVDQVIEKHEALRKSEGKKVFQVQPRADWNKGRAVRWLLDHTNLGAGNPLAIYIGDDLTDEDAFEELSDDGIGIVVRDGSRATAADYSLQDPEDVQGFLVWLAERYETA